MAGKTQTLKFKRTVNAPIAEVFRAFTNATALREWLSDGATLEARQGGRIYLWWNDGYFASGQVTRFVPNKKLAFTWAGWHAPGAMHIDVTLAEENGDTRVTISHAGLGSGKAWAGTVKSFQRAWPLSLENLQSVMETGHDLRFTLRPMLGINIGEFNADIARKLGVPVTEGIRLDGVVEGMGAHAAGLQKDDVIVNMAGKKIFNWPSLTATLLERRAGDVVKVAYYRGAEKRAATMTLSKRPLPDVPMTAAGLAEAVGKIDADFQAHLAKTFEGVTDAQAGRDPRPGEWSAKDVLCHLIAGERDTHAWIIDLIGGQERWSDDWPGNIRTRHAGILASFPNVPALLEELCRNQAETAALLAALPAAFVARRGSLWRLGYSLLQAPDHNNEHITQIRAAVESARKK